MGSRVVERQGTREAKGRGALMEIEVTDELIDALKTRNGGWKRESLALLGVDWPPKKGWRKRILGTRIQVSDDFNSRQVCTSNAGEEVPHLSETGLVSDSEGRF